MFGFMITIQFLYYDMFRPLFVAIIRQYLYSQSQLSLLSPLHYEMFTTGEGLIVVYNIGFQLYRLKQLLYVNHINVCPGVPNGVRYLQ
jgi:hypothetical protein